MFFVQRVFVQVPRVKHQSHRSCRCVLISSNRCVMQVPPLHTAKSTSSSASSSSDTPQRTSHTRLSGRTNSLPLHTCVCVISSSPPLSSAHCCGVRVSFMQAMWLCCAWSSSCFRFCMDFSVCEVFFSSSSVAIIIYMSQRISASGGLTVVERI